MAAHWLTSEFEMNSLPLGLFLHEGGTNNSDVYRQFYDDVSRKLADESIQVFGVTTDTTGNMNKFGKFLEENLVYHIYCSDHLLHLTAITCFSGNTEANAIKKVSQLCSLFNYSTQLLADLHRVQRTSNSYKGKSKKPISDVVTS